MSRLWRNWSPEERWQLLCEGEVSAHQVISITNQRTWLPSIKGIHVELQDTPPCGFVNRDDAIKEGYRIQKAYRDKYQTLLERLKHVRS
jgi:hypothetical protein